jgi:hypothetical protein
VLYFENVHGKKGSFALFHLKLDLCPKNTFGRPQSILPTTTIIQFDRFSIVMA